MTYNPDGTVASVVQPDGQTTTPAYTTDVTPAMGGGVTPVGLPRTTVDAVGNTTTFDYDSKGNLTRAMQPGGRSRRLRLRPAGPGHDDEADLRHVPRRCRSRGPAMTPPAGGVHRGPARRRPDRHAHPHARRQHHLRCQRQRHPGVGDRKQGWDPAWVTTATLHDADRVLDTTPTQADAEPPRIDAEARTSPQDLYQGTDGGAPLHGAGPRSRP